jgi:hypothetical protein
MPDQVTTTAGKEQCRSMVDQVFSKMNSLWINVRRECGQWPYNGYKGSGANSEKCNAAISELRVHASYIAFDGSSVAISQAFTKSISEGINWRGNGPVPFGIRNRSRFVVGYWAACAFFFFLPFYGNL